jgi:3D (Asp-Asp-Asp) domain-containing protein
MLAERARIRSRRLIIALVAVLAVGGASVAVAMLTGRDPSVDPASAEGADHAASAPPAGPNAAVPPADPNALGAPPPVDAGPTGATPPGGTVAPGESAPRRDAVPATPKASKPAAKPGEGTAKPGSSAAAKATPSASAKAGESSTRASAGDEAAKAKPAGRQVPIELTGYSFHDNTPAGSAEVSNPVLHKTAGGRGSYADPITVAVPSDSKFDPGTRFYLPSVRRYAIVEDSGASSTSGNHLDLWVDGEGGSERAVEACMDQLTGESTAEVNPPPGRPVIPGPIFDGSCHLPKG